jgi:D-alanine--poly(phosphoribitol) ligase subunit 2
MSAEPTMVDRVRILIRDVLSFEVPTDNTDLIDSGVIDSLALVTMIAEIEEEFQVELPLDDFDVEQFRSVQRIAEFLSKALLPVT